MKNKPFLAILFVSISWLLCQCSTMELNQPIKEDSATASTKTKTTTRAVSLRVLQEKAKECQKLNNCPDAIIYLGKLTRIEGYAIDIDNQDIILFGQADATKPPLHTEDFVIALKNTWFKYAKIEGNTRYYSYPTISIDPDPKVISQLERIGSVNINKWHEICSQSQKVRVIGIPFNSHFAKTMVVPDYDMKKLVGGPDNHGISGLVSLAQMSLIKIRTDFAEGKSNSMPISSMNRFWFTPGENLYQENEGVVIIKQSPVTLKTEEQFLSHKGELIGTKKTDSLSQEFAEKFTKLYPEIARKRPIYGDLENLFRFVAISKIMKFKAAFTEAGLELDYFLNEYKIPQTPLARQLPGYAHVGYLEEDSVIIRLPSCGGVGIDLEVSEKNFVTDSTGYTAELATKVIQTRPKREAFFWEVI